jgi:hypothetical protein
MSVYSIRVSCRTLAAPLAGPAGSTLTVRSIIAPRLLAAQLAEIVLVRLHQFIVVRHGLYAVCTPMTSCRNDSHGSSKNPKGCSSAAAASPAPRTMTQPQSTPRLLSLSPLHFRRSSGSGCQLHRHCFWRPGSPPRTYASQQRSLPLPFLPRL